MIKSVKKYTKQDVKNLRGKRRFVTSNGTSDVIKTDADYRAFLGELKGAGHLTIGGFESLKIQTHPSIMGTGYKEVELKFIIPIKSGSNDKPHFTGYIQSAADVDSQRYTVRAWVNEGGSIRLEIVK
jgi:hypothetical protein